MVLDETMNEPDFSPSAAAPSPEAALPQLALVPIWNDYSQDGQEEGLPFLLFDDEDSEDEEDMTEDEGFDSIDDDFGDDFDDDEDEFDDEDEDYEDEDDDYNYDEGMDYDDFDE